MAQSSFNLSGIPDAKAGAKKQTFDLLDIPDSADVEKKRTDAEKVKAYQDAMREAFPVMNASIGAVKGAANTVMGFTNPVRRSLGKKPWTPFQAEGTAQKIGMGAEQMGEFFLPEAAGAKALSVLPKIGKAAEFVTRASFSGIGSYGVAAAQGDPHPIWAAALSMVLSPFGVLGNAAPGVKASAEKSMGKALSSGVDTSKKSAKKAIHESVSRVFDLGLSPTWKKMLSKADVVKERAWQKIPAELATPVGGKPVPIQPVLDALEAVADKARNIVPLGKHGQPIGAGPGAGSFQTVSFNSPMIRKVEQLKEILEKHGPTIEARQLHAIKSDWDHFVRAGKKHGAAIKDTFEARAKAAATDAMRDVLLSETPSISRVDQEYHLANQTYNVIADAAGIRRLSKGEQSMATAGTSAVRRTAAMTLGGAAGVYGGSTLGHSPAAATVGMILGGVTGQMLEQAMHSPGWRLLPATVKNQIAIALANGRAETVRRLVAPVIASTAAGSRLKTDQIEAKQ